MDLHLANHAVIVTGGASGIGLAAAAAFAAEGARVALWDLGDAATRAADQWPTANNPLAVTADIADEAAIAAALAQTIEALGPIDHLVHAAAIGSGKFGFPFTNLTPTDW